MTLFVEPHHPWVMNALPYEPVTSRSGWLQDLIGEPPRPIVSELNSRDFVFLTREAIEARIENVRTAEQWIDQIPSLSSAVRRIVREVFLLGAREEYDVSHSEPRWPNWIFVSVPRSAGVVSALRFAENVVHEAMHLQLTDMEAQVALVADMSSLLHSPWKQAPRQLQGILHGLYVCACISAFFSFLLREESLPRDGINHIGRRNAAIADEISMVPMERLREGLTEPGKQFLQAIQPVA